MFSYNSDKGYLTIKNKRTTKGALGA